MEFKEIKKEILRVMRDQEDDASKFTLEYLRKKVTAILEHMEFKGRCAFANKSARENVIESICNDLTGFGPLQSFMDDKEVTEIMVNGTDSIYVEKHGKKTKSNLRFDDEEHLRYIIHRMISPTGRRVDESSPFVDFSLDNGSRVNVIIPPLATGGPKLTVRKFLQDITTVDDLVKIGTIDARMAEFLIACIKAKLNIIFSGATGSGKTTTLEVLSSYIAHNERIITIEDARELHLRQEHVLYLLTRPSNIEGKGEIDSRALFRNTLRMRPSRIILGEIRGEEAMDYLQALNSGHSGCLAVIHAARPSEVIARLETMAMYAGLNVSPWGVRKQISSGLNLIVQMEQFVDGSRKITYITEVGEVKEGHLVLHDIFRFESLGIDSDGRVKGAFKAVGMPRFLSFFRRRGVELSENILKMDITDRPIDYVVE